MKESVGLKLGLREGRGGELEIWDEDKGVKVMTFCQRNRLYYLEQGKTA